MIKTIAYFPLQCSLNSVPVMGAVLDCLQARGIQTQENSLTSDAAVIWSVLWQGRMSRNKEIYNEYRRQNKPVIIIEVGALYRGHTWKVAVDHITREGFYGHETELDWDRPGKLSVSKAIILGAKPEIVIAAQHRNSLQTASIPNLEQWVLDQIALVRQHTDRPIAVRPHPRCRLSLPKLPRGVILEQPRPVANTYDNFDMHYDCHAVINYNSGPGIQAAIAGCRPVVDQSSLAWPVGIQLSDIEVPYTVDRDLWLTQICHTESTLDELKGGIWLNRISSALSR
jgi:hypothetical protein